MRSLRFVFLLAAIGVGGFVARDYWEGRRYRATTTEVQPETLEADLNSRSARWNWSQQTADESTVEISAGGFRQGADRSKIELKDVELRIYRADDHTFDRVETPQAFFDIGGNLFRSEAETTITLGVPFDDPDADSAELTRIRTTDVTFDTKTGGASTNQETRYVFENGTGRSLGAEYSSLQRYFAMKTDVEVTRLPSSPGGRKTEISAGRLVYQEAEQRVDLDGGASLRRGAQSVDAASAVLHLVDGVVRRIDAPDAVGEQQRRDRRVTFRTPRLEAFFTEQGAVERLVGAGRSRLASIGATSKMEAVGERVDLTYDPPAEEGDDSRLREAFLRGDARVEIGPGDDGGAAERRTVVSEAIQLHMRPDGEQIELVETHEPAELTLQPAGTGAAERRLTAARVRMEYADGNRMRSLEAHGDVHTARSGRGDEAPPLETWSGSLEAALDPETGELTALRQWSDFRFVQGSQKGEAGEARFDADAERLELKGAARVDDATGVLRAFRITLDQVNDRVEAEGEVSSSYREAAGRQGQGLFQSSEPVYATAREMQSDQKTGELVYRGGARLWQGANRIEAEMIRIDRQAKTLAAEGNVLTFLREGDRKDGDSDAGLVRIRAERMAYDEATRLARYSGGVTLERNQMRVRSRELEAVVRSAEGDREAGLESAEARGEVEITEAGGGRRGLGDWASFDPESGEVVLEGKPARALTPAGDETRGAQLTYKINDDRLLVLGGSERAYTFRRRK